ncbi:hypothetical protein HAX54_022360, partial [Datura stramonium]|nr:hypothetical protein [Datura stramonium]
NACIICEYVFFRVDVGVYFEEMGTTTINYPLATASTPYRTDALWISTGGSLMSHQWKFHCPSVLLTIDSSSAFRGSLPAICQNSTGAASSFMIIPPLVSHLLFR